MRVYGSATTALLLLVIGFGLVEPSTNYFAYAIPFALF
jgi:hypothetical protein